MQRRQGGIGVGIAVAAACGAAVAGQDTVTVADYEAAMNELRYVATETAMHIEASYFVDLKRDAETLREELTTVETFWREQGQDAALALAGQALAATRTIAEAVDAEDGPAAGAALADLRDTCNACHQQFREETADGFRIVPSALP